MTRRCSHCSNNGHNSRTCPTRGAAGAGSSGGGGGGLGGGGVKLFGVRLTDGSFIKKSASMGNLMHYHSAAAASVSPSPGSPSDLPHDPPGPLPDGYLSDDPNHASCSSNRRSERKKGTPWTAEEHRLFLLGLQKLGKGDWRGISRNYVVSRTPTQVASHAQKYFIRQSNASRRKRRSSLFDMIPDMETDPQSVPEEDILSPPLLQAAETTNNTNSLPSLDLSLGTEAAEPEPMETTSSEQAEEETFGESQVPEDLQQPVLPPLFPTFISYPSYPSYPFPYWSPNIAQTENNLHTTTSNHTVLKPTPVIPKEPVNVDELVGMSKLKLSEAETGQIGPPQLSLNLLGAPSRQSAFHASTAAPFNSADLAEGKSSIIKAV